MTIEKNQQVSFTQDITPQHLNEKVTSKLFVRMGSNYGHLWTSQWRTDDLLNAARKEWAMELGGYDNGIIGMALRKCKAKHIDHPPTLPQFSALCKSCSPSCQAHREYKCLAPPKTTTEKAQENIKKMREAINNAEILL